MKAILLTLKTAAIMAVITLALLALVEVGLRLAFPTRAAQYAEELERVANLAYAPHPEFQVMLKPGITKAHVPTDELAGDFVEWTTNSVGQRGPEPRSDADLRIIVYGDSNVHARFSALEDTFPKQIESLLSSGGRDVEVMNAGIVGYGPDQSLLRFRADLTTLKPDIIVVNILANNDFGDLIRNRLFDLDADGNLVRTDFPVTTDSHLMPTVSRFMILRAAQSVARKLAGLRAYHGFESLPPQEQIDHILDRLAFEHSRFADGLPKAVSHFEDKYDYDLSLFPDSDAARAKVGLMRAVTAAFAREAEAAGVGVLFTIQPASLDLFFDGFERNRLLPNYPGYRPRALTEYLEQSCVDFALDCINLYDPYKAAGAEGLFWPHDIGHWNNRGQALAASLAAEYIVANMLNR